MYIRTQDDRHLEIYQEDNNQPYVMPESVTKWGLRVDDDEDQKPMLISTFKTLKDANAALRSLRGAIEGEEGWDAIEFKKSLESGTSI